MGLLHVDVQCLPFSPVLPLRRLSRQKVPNDLQGRGRTEQVFPVLLPFRLEISCNPPGPDQHLAGPVGLVRVNPLRADGPLPRHPVRLGLLDDLEDLLHHVLHLLIAGLAHQRHRQLEVVNIVPSVLLHVVADLPDLLHVVLDVIVPLLLRD